MACLCAPTSHEGSFRCRLHRVPNPITNPAQSSANHPFKVVNYCTHSYNIATANQIACIPNITVRESSSSTSMPPYPFDDHVRFSHTPQLVTSDPQNSSRTRPSSSSLSDTLAVSSSSSSSSSPSPSPYWSSTSPKSPSYRLPSSSSSLYTPSSSSSSRASASSSSPSPSSPFYCTRPPPAKRPSSSYSSPSKPPYRVSSSPAPTSSWCGAASSTTPSPSHAAALAIMKQHSHNKHGARTHNRNILSPASASKIGPSRLSRMAVACADELPLPNREEHYISNSLQHGSAPDTLPGSFADTTMPSGFAQFKAAPIGLKTRSAVNKLKQSESSCRIVGSKGGSLIMPTVY